MSRSRRASRASHDFRPRTATPSTPGSAALGLDLTGRARAAIDGHVRLLLAWTDGDQPDRHPRSGRGRRRARPRQPDRRRRCCATLRRRRVRRPRLGRRLPGLPLAVALPAARGAARRADRQEGPLPRDRGRGRRAGGDDRDRRDGRVARSGPRPSPRDPAHRGRWPAVTARAVASLADLVELALPLLAPGGDPRRLEARRPRRGARRRPAGARRARRRRLEIAPGRACRRWPAMRWSWSPPRGRVPAAYPRDPAARQRRPW